MGIKANNQEYDVVNDNPLAFSLFNFGSNSTSLFPPPPNKFMITEIAGDFMQMELSTDLMITEF